ncbi:MAG: hypothetical protein JNM85_04045 [Chthonomonas sp.]|nr:hypothetical protein [Chthonomonas sp.]
MNKRIAGAALTAIVVAGCSQPKTSYLPLEVGYEWKYTVTAGLQSSVETLKCVQNDSVAGTSGFRLQGPAGQSRYAWKAGVLVAEELAGTRYAPELPIFAPGLAKGKNMTWKGQITIAHRTFTASGVLMTESGKISFGGRETNSLRSELTLTLKDQPFKIVTWYVDRVGMVRQEERAGDRLMRSVEYISGP